MIVILMLSAVTTLTINANPYTEFWTDPSNYLSNQPLDNQNIEERYINRNTLKNVED
jgi:hypothetical protein